MAADRKKKKSPPNGALKTNTNSASTISKRRKHRNSKGRFAFLENGKRIQFQESLRNSATSSTPYKPSSDSVPQSMPPSDGQFIDCENDLDVEKDDATVDCLPKEDQKTPPPTPCLPEAPNQWKTVGPVGPGLNNLGNTCFLNSVLQCLSYCPPLANYLMDDHKDCALARKGSFCLLCQMSLHVRKTFGHGNSSSNHYHPSYKNKKRSFSPSNIISNLPLIANHFCLGDQEDSHEFLRYMIDGMNNSNPTIINSIFGGKLRSRIVCTSCQTASCTYDPMQDLSLEIKRSPNLLQALKDFIRAETLNKENRYLCHHCSSLSQAEKRMSIWKAPNVLTIHLKRFEMSPMGDGWLKINRHIPFEVTLDLGPYIGREGAHAGNRTLIYDLFAVLVHDGHCCNSGHYRCYVKASNSCWYSMDDSCVSQVSLNTVLNERAYILFYTKKWKPPTIAKGFKVTPLKG